MMARFTVDPAQLQPVVDAMREAAAALDTVGAELERTRQEAAEGWRLAESHARSLVSILCVKPVGQGTFGEQWLAEAKDTVGRATKRTAALAASSAGEEGTA